MTPARYRTCLAELKLSQRGLAPVLGCSDRITREWATGKIPIPPEIGVWLETCVTLRKAKGRFRWPLPPEWRRRSVVWITYKGERMPLTRACTAAGIKAVNSVRHARLRDGITWQAAFNQIAAKRKSI